MKINFPLVLSPVDNYKFLVYYVDNNKRKEHTVTDLERLENWMKKRGLSKKQMAREMGITYINLYHTMVVRYPKTNKIAGNFIVRFSATYGSEVATEIFSELAPREATTEPQPVS